MMRWFKLVVSAIEHVVLSSEAHKSLFQSLMVKESSLDNGPGGINRCLDSSPIIE